MSPNDLQKLFSNYAQILDIDDRAMLCIDGAGFKELADIDDFEFATIVQFNLMLAYLRKHDLIDDSPGEGADSMAHQPESLLKPAPDNDDAVASREPAE